MSSNGAWVLLIKKIPTRPSPSKLSIFWSVPWPHEHYSIQQAEQWLDENEHEEEFYLDDRGEHLSREMLIKKALLEYATHNIHVGATGVEHNWAGARKIHFANTDIRIFPDEFKLLSNDAMAKYVGVSDEASHVLIPSSVADATLIQEVLSGSLREIFDAAMVDGASDTQAQAMAFGVDVSEENFLSSFPAIGWYRCKYEYAKIFCTEQEIREDYGGQGQEDVVVNRKSKRRKK
jgi:hypothetical protein